MTDQHQQADRDETDTRLNRPQAEPDVARARSSPEYPGLADLDKAIQNRQLTGFLEERSMPLRYIWYFAGLIVAIFLVLIILI